MGNTVDAAARAIARAAGRIRRDDRGFTLIELVVVVIVIGILAAIAIPVYVGVQNNARDASVKSDLTNARQAVAIHLQTQNGVYAPLASLASDGYSGPGGGYASAADTPNYKGAALPASGATSFCLQAKSPTATMFFTTESDGVKAGTCP